MQLFILSFHSRCLGCLCGKCSQLFVFGFAAIMEKIPDQIGYLVLTEDGAVLESGGELENDERVATIITDLITLSNK